MSNTSWNLIFDVLKIREHNFAAKPFFISAEEIKEITKIFTETGMREARILCKQDNRESRPEIFKEMGLFILPIKNGNYAILQGEGYIDIPEIKNKTISYSSKLEFELETSKIGNSEMQHLDFAYASSIIRTFVEDNSLVLTIRGRKYTPEFEFKANNHILKIKGVQTEIDAGYEGKNKIVLVEAKNSSTSNVIIRQLFYPFKQWSEHSKKEISLIFFEKREGEFCLWEYSFLNSEDYNSIKLIKSAKFQIL